MLLNPAEFDAFVRAEIESNANLIKAAGIAPN
jgi:tripartite-type tricarboxylate transporter receptor subunit TctC